MLREHVAWVDGFKRNLIHKFPEKCREGIIA
jgi:hypothetical protein